MKGICIVGCGAIGRVHAQLLAGRAKLFFHSRSPESARRLQAESPGSGGVIERWEAVLEHPEVDAVAICSPPEHHADQVVAALGAGKAVLVEKPLCTSREEVGRIEQALAAPAAPLFMVAENYYYKPSLARIKALIRSGRVGKLRRVAVRKELEMATVGWKSAHGALLEGGIHFVALLSDIVEDRPVRVAARRTGPGAPDAPERGSVITVEYERGAVAELVYAWNVKSLTHGVFQHSRVEGDRGSILFESNGLYVASGGWIHLPGLRDLTGRRGMTEDFLACLADRERAPYSDFKRAQRDLDIVFRAYEQLASSPSPRGRG